MVHKRFAVRVGALALLASLAPAGRAEEPGAAGEVHLLHIQTIIHPIAAQYLEKGIAEADAAGAAALVLELDTPGGLLTSTREMSEAMLGAETPVIVYVAPSGAQAASAGFFLLMSGDVAAMAPGTNTGAAHPVGGQGEDIEGTLGEKVEQDSAATIRSLAKRNGRDAALAESAVVESRSFTADEALENGLIDVVASDVEDLLTAIDGRTITKADGGERVLSTAGATIRAVDMTAFERFLSALAHPNIAYMLLTLGGLGLYFELSSPGAVLPGVLGAISLLLAFFALSVLPVNYAGIALIALALVLFVAEIKVTSYGLLTVGGIVSLALGSSMLFDSPDPAIRVSLSVIAIVTAFAAVLVVILLSLVVRTYRTQVRTGSEGMVSQRGVVRSALAPVGKIFVHGELWDAETDSDAEVPVGATVEVLAVEGMRLRVRPLPRRAS
ncbi:MAG: nodulation protein NfeD [Thermoanaerobaculia bacterium]